jgi:tryptophan-rich sensory protein
MNEYITYYESLIKPFFAPPSYVFGIAWGIIYPLIGIAFVYFIYLCLSKKIEKLIQRRLLFLFVVNMIANFLFTPILFVIQSNVLASLDIIFIWVTLFAFEYISFKNSKFLFTLMLPYLLWVTFAMILQLNLTWLNIY